MKEKIKYINIIMILTILLLTIKSNAAMEIKPGTSAWTNITVSESYQQCYDLRNSDTTLGKNTLDPHLTLNSDWATVSYLAASAYGGVNNSTNGPQTAIDGKNYNTTTGNASGVMNFGKTCTHTSALIDGIGRDDYAINLKNNLNTKYVENINSSFTIETTKGQALKETYGWWGSSQYFAWANTHAVIRSRIFGIDNMNDTAGEGAASSATFRPVIWND